MALLREHGLRIDGDRRNGAASAGRSGGMRGAEPVDEVSARHALGDWAAARRLDGALMTAVGIGEREPETLADTARPGAAASSVANAASVTISGPAPSCGVRHRCVSPAAAAPLPAEQGALEEAALALEVGAIEVQRRRGGGAGEQPAG
jgi:hypothetical protein